MKNFKLLGLSVGAVLLLITGLIINPFGWNDGGERTVIQQAGGKQFVQFAPGMYYQGFFAKETIWPNQISVTYQENAANYDLVDNGIEVGQIGIRFSDATTANVKGIVQYILPNNEKDMIFIHNTHRTPESLVQKRLAPYTKECLQSSAQLMSSEKHYGGGRAQMAQDFMDQLQGGVFLLATEEDYVYDSLEQKKKRIYITEKTVNKKTGTLNRKQSSIAEYGVTVADAAITDVDYEEQVDKKLNKIIDAVTQAAISKQDLMTAQQKALTAKAEGEKKLVEIEYATKQEQTKQVVQAQTKVEVAKQDKLERQIAYEAALIEVKERQAKADVAAYEKKTTIQANGALELKLQTWLMSQQYWAEAFGKYQGNIAPQIQTGGWSPNGGGNNAAVNFMEIMGAKASRDLAIDMKK